MVARVGIARKGMEDALHPKCPACGSFMKSFKNEPEVDCTSCGCVWALPQAY